MPPLWCFSGYIAYSVLFDHGLASKFDQRFGPNIDRFRCHLAPDVESTEHFRLAITPVRHLLQKKCNIRLPALVDKYQPAIACKYRHLVGH